MNIELLQTNVTIICVCTAVFLAWIAGLKTGEGGSDMFFFIFSGIIAIGAPLCIIISLVSIVIITFSKP